MSSDLIVANAMVDVLTAQRAEGNASFPLTLREIGQLAQHDASGKLILGAAGKNAFKKTAIAARYKDLDAPVALLEDAEALVESPQTLSYLLRICSHGKCTAHTIAELKKKLTGCHDNRFKKHFQATVEQQIRTESLPSKVGYIAGGRGSMRLFHLDHLQPSRWRKILQEALRTPASVPSTSVDTFSALLDTAFTKIDRDGGGYNFVTLESLRDALPQFDRQDFDSKIRELRLARRYQLSAAENRTDLSPSQRAAGISEAGSLLIYVQRTK